VGLADELCAGRIAMVQEGGYSEAYVPFCAHAVLAALAGVENAVADPFLPIVLAQQPGADFNAAQTGALKAHPFWRD